MSIFDHDDYKQWAITHILSMPNGGRGQYRRIADFLVTSPTIVTQVFKGDRELTPEQAVLLSEYFALSKIESRYLILLVNYSRAASYRYKKLLKEEIEELRLQAREIKNRVPHDLKLTDEAKATLYSNWYYLAIWSLTAIKGFDNLEAISTHLGLSRKKVSQAIEFLKMYKLILENEHGALVIGPTLIHLESDSPNIARHHQNWRLQAFKRYENPSASDVFYTAPVTLSAKDATAIREKILGFISESVNLIKDSPSEELHCLCLDWFTQ